MTEYDSVIPAGGSGTLTAKMKTSLSQNGRVSKSISVFTDAPGAETLRLRFTVDIQTPITAKPTMRFALNTLEGKGLNQRLLLERTDGKPLVIRKTAVPLKGLTVTALAVDETIPKGEPEKESTPTPWGAPNRQMKYTPLNGMVWLDLRSDPSLPVGRYTGKLRLATNHPEAPEIEIPYTVRVRPLIEVRPNVVSMWADSTANAGGRSATVTFKHHGKRPFAITSITVSHPKIFSAVSHHREASTRQSIRVGLVEDHDGTLLGAGLEGWIRIATDDAEMPQLEVPVVITPKRTAGRPQ